MPAPAFYPEALGSRSTDDIFTPSAVKNFLAAIAALPENFDTVICDLPARPDGLYRTLVPEADKIIVVSMHTAVSIRAAEKTAIALHELCTGPKKPDMLLAVNGFRAKSCGSRRQRRTIRHTFAHQTPLIGVLPYDGALSEAQNKGLLAFETPRSALSGRPWKTPHAVLTAKTCACLRACAPAFHAQNCIDAYIPCKSDTSDTFTERKTFMEIAIIASDRKKELMTEFCMAYKAFCANTIFMRRNRPENTFPTRPGLPSNVCFRAEAAVSNSSLPAFLIMRSTCCSISAIL